MNYITSPHYNPAAPTSRFVGVVFDAGEQTVERNNIGQAAAYFATAFGDDAVLEVRRADYREPKQGHTCEDCGVTGPQVSDSGCCPRCV